MHPITIAASRLMDAIIVAALLQHCLYVGVAAEQWAGGAPVAKLGLARFLLTLRRLGSLTGEMYLLLCNVPNLLSR